MVSVEQEFDHRPVLFPDLKSAVAPTPPSDSPSFSLIPKAFSVVSSDMHWNEHHLCFGVMSHQYVPKLCGEGTSAASGNGRARYLCCQLFSLHSWWSGVRQQAELFSFGFFLSVGGTFSLKNNDVLMTALG